jgi:UDP-N-acetylglucosamine--N-acetylmuramyl-(pentapeptide) pyrophosphoryl-undecaprenol N-acetylglucosamine transferase
VGAADVLLDRDLSSERLVAWMLGVMGDDGRRRMMSEAMRAWARPDADARVADLVAGIAG